MPPKAKYYSASFRANAVRLAAESDRPVTEVAQDLGIKYNQLYGWMRKAGKTKRIHDTRLPKPAPPPPPETAEEEVRRLRRELDEMRMERDFLKKAAAFFARMNK
ncbi:MAG: transposase [Myxococcales bacterium]|nr:transposase [Myxococcales bacterium]